MSKNTQLQILLLQVTMKDNEACTASQNTQHHAYMQTTHQSQAMQHRIFSPPLQYRAVSMATGSRFWHWNVETCRKYARPPGRSHENGWRARSVVMWGGGVLKSWGLKRLQKHWSRPQIQRNTARDFNCFWFILFHVVVLLSSGF